MTIKADFDAEEWSLLLEGPPLAGMRVLTADKGGTIQETVAIGRFYGDARRHQNQAMGKTGLIDELAADAPHVDHSRFGSPDHADADALRDATTGCLRDAVMLLERKALAEELEDYRRFVLGLAQVVAEAHKEGGFLGIGGTHVSDKEQNAIDELREALGTPDR